MPYFALFSYIGPRDPGDNNRVKLVAISVDTKEALFDWLDKKSMKNFEVLIMSDKHADIALQFGFLQKAAGLSATKSIFINDNKNMIWHQLVQDSRMLGELKKSNEAFQESDKFKGLSKVYRYLSSKDDLTIMDMATMIPNIKHHYWKRSEKRTMVGRIKKIWTSLTNKS